MVPPEALEENGFLPFPASGAALLTLLGSEPLPPSSKSAGQHLQISPSTLSAETSAWPSLFCV